MTIVVALNWQWQELQELDDLVEAARHELSGSAQNTSVCEVLRTGNG